MMSIDYTKFLKPIGSGLFSCSCCGTSLKENELVVACADCGAIFCEQCVRNGEVNNHECEDEYFGNEDEVD